MNSGATVPADMWGGYPRISEDPDDVRAGVTRQREDIVDEVTRLGGDPQTITWYPENNTSAYKKKRIVVKDPLGNEYVGYRVIRPKWHQALHDLRTGVIKGLVVWDLDRLARDPRDLEDAIEAVEFYGATILSATASEIDLTTETGRMQARLLVLIANKSSADTARRVKRAHLAKARTGEPVGGTRPFGWEDDKLTERKEEADAIREAARVLIEGESLAEVVRRWNEAGLKTSRGNTWNRNTLRQLLKSSRYAGWRVHSGEVAVDRNGQSVKGTWEPILDEDTWDRLQLVFTRADPRTRKPRRDSRHYLLTGLIRCGICNGLLYGNRHTDGKFYYVCNEQRVKNHGLGGSGLAIDRLVTKHVRMKIDERAEDGASADEPWPGEARYEEIGVEIRGLMDELRSPDAAPGDIYRRVADLEDEKAEMEKDRTRWLESSTGPVLRRMSDEEWEAMTVDLRRAHIEQVLEAVIVKPATRRGNQFDPERLVFVPKRTVS